MKASGKGFTFVELIIAMGITFLITLASTTALFQIFGATDRNNNRLTVARQTENAGFWISRDAQRAQGVSTSNLTAPDILLLNWMQWDASGNPIYYSARYSFDNITAANIGRLKRYYWNSLGDNQTTLVGINLYYNPSDSENSSMVSYQSPVITVRLTAIVDKARETREYRIKRRPNV